MSVEIGAVILAAGRGRRLGMGPKAFVRVEGRTLLDRAHDLLQGAGITRLAAVLPPKPDPVVLGPSLVVARNDAPESGPLASVVLGLSAIEATGPVVALLVHHVDHAGVSDSDVRAVLDGLARAERGVIRVVPEHGGRRGHPIGIRGEGLAAIRRCEAPAETTLRALLEGTGSTLIVPGSEGVLRNVNTPSELSAMIAP